MKRVASMTLVVLIVFGSFVALLSVISINANAQLTNSPWPMFHGNLRHTGLSPYDTSNNHGTLKWKFQTGGSVLSSPAIGPDGTIYVGSWDDYLYAIGPSSGGNPPTQYWWLFVIIVVVVIGIIAAVLLRRKPPAGQQMVGQQTQQYPPQQPYQQPPPYQQTGYPPPSTDEEYQKEKELKEL